VLEGDLGDFSIAEILQLLGYTKKSGRLQLHGPRAAGRMVLSEGGLMDVTADVARLGVVRRLLGLGYVDPDPIHEILEGSGQLPTDRQLLTGLVERGHLDAELAEQVGHNHALESLAELLRWTEGSFRFDADKSAAAGMDAAEALPTDTMLAQANERLADWDRLTERIGPGDQVVTLISPMPPRDVTVPAAAWGLLMFVDGQRTIDELAAVSGRGAYDTRAALVDLLDQGLVSLGQEASERAYGFAEAIARIAELEDTHHPGAAVDAAGAFGKASDEEQGAGEEYTATHTPAQDEVDAPAASHAEVAADEPPVPAGEPAPVAETAPDPAAADLTAVQSGETTPDGSRGLRTRVRGERLRTDPTIDEDLVSRLIDGVEGM
jgi:hypothetical protein